MATAPKAKKTATAKKSKTASSDEFTSKKFKDFTISKKRSGRFAVVDKSGKNVNGIEKAKILVEAKLVQAGFPKTEAAAPAEEAPTT